MWYNSKDTVRMTIITDFHIPSLFQSNIEHIIKPSSLNPLNIMMVRPKKKCLVSRAPPSCMQKVPHQKILLHEINKMVASCLIMFPSWFLFIEQLLLLFRLKNYDQHVRQISVCMTAYNKYTKQFHTCKKTYFTIQ